MILRRPATCTVWCTATLLLVVVAPEAAGAPPEQVHVTLGDDGDTLVVQWAVSDAYGVADTPQVRWSVAGQQKAPSPGRLVGEVDAGSGEADRSTYVYASGLTPVPPGALVAYEPGSAADGFAGPYDVRMPPAVDERIRFVAYGDISIDDVGPDGTAVSSGAPSQRVQDLALAQDPDLVVVPGDLAYTHERAGWDTFMRFMEPLQASTVVMPSLGNHEYNDTFGYSRFLEHYVLPGDEENYAFQAGPVSFVAVNSDAMCGPGRAPTGSPPGDVCPDGSVDQDQAAWLRDRLREAAADETNWTVVYFHHPPYSWGHHGGNAGVRSLWVPWFDEYEVDLVLSGHDHLYSRSHPMRGGEATATGSEYTRGNGVVYVVAGGGGRGLYPLPSGEPPSWHAAGESVHHLVRVDATAERVDVTALRADGSTLDSFSIIADRPPGSTSPSPAPGILVAFCMAAVAAVALRRLRKA